MEAKTMRRIIAAYLLDRADQYYTSSPCWIALADAAKDIVNGAADAAYEHGELEAALMSRVDGLINIAALADKGAP